MGVNWKDWCWSWNYNTLATWCKELTHLKKPWCWERLKAGEEGEDRGWDDLMASLTQSTCVWVNPGVDDGQRALACCNPWGCKELDTIERLNWIVTSQVLYTPMYHFIFTIILLEKYYHTSLQFRKSNSKLIVNCT